LALSAATLPPQRKPGRANTRPSGYLKDLLTGIRDGPSSPLTALGYFYLSATLER